MSFKQLLFSLAWILPLIGGIVSLFMILSARRALRASHQHIPAFLLNAIALIIIGMGSLLLNYEYGWTSAVLMLIASLFLLLGIVLIFRHLPRS